MDAFKLMKELRVNYEQEAHYLPRETGLRLIESTTEDDSRISAKCRDAKVEDVWSLTSFFGYSTQTFVLAVNLLDRFLAMIRIQPKHLSCVSVSCLHMAAKVTEEECNLAPPVELIRIGQCRFTASDLCRMEKIVAEKLNFKSKAVTALTFLDLYHQIALSHGTDGKEILSLEKLEAQLKACLCRISFSKAKPSVLALSLLRQEIHAVQSEDMLEIACHIQRHLKITDAELRLWSERVARCLSDYSSPECSKPNHRKLQWIVSRRTAQNLHSYRTVPELPTIPEHCWDESERRTICRKSSAVAVCRSQLSLSRTIRSILRISDGEQPQLLEAASSFRVGRRYASKEEEEQQVFQMLRSTRGGHTQNPIRGFFFLASGAWDSPGLPWELWEGVRDWEKPVRTLLREADWEEDEATGGGAWSTGLSSSRK